MRSIRRAFATACLALLLAAPMAPVRANAIDPLYYAEPPMPVQDALLLPAGTFTTAFSARLTVTPVGLVADWTDLLYLGNGPASRVALFFQPGTTTLWFDSVLGASTTHVQGPTLALNVPTEIGLVFDSAGLRLYADGVLGGSSGLPANWSLDGPLYLSSPWYAAANATVSKLAIYDRALSAAEMAAPIEFSDDEKVPEPGTLALLALGLLGLATRWTRNSPATSGATSMLVPSSNVLTRSESRL